MNIINPYKGIDFTTIPKINAISHEHIYTTDQLKKAWDRGIRYFACINYQPACPSYPLTGWNAEFEDWNYFDISNYHKGSGTGVNKDIFTPEEARKKLRVRYGLFSNIRQQGIIIRYKTSDTNVVYDKLINFTSTDDWNQVCSDNSRWVQYTEGNYESALEKCTRYDISKMEDFTDKDGNLIHIADLVTLPNAEHPTIGSTKGKGGVVNHINSLGSIYPDAGWSIGRPLRWTADHPQIFLEDIHLFQEHTLYPNKMFGTINHNYSFRMADTFMETNPTFFNAIEIHNNGYTKLVNKNYRSCWDYLLTKGYRLWGVSVVDWQNYIEGDPMPGEDMSHYEKEYDGDRGCNVLLIAGYDSMSMEQKKEAGLDAYISGSFYASAFGRHSISTLNVIGESVEFEVDGNPSKICAVSNLGEIKGAGNNMKVNISEGMTYLRFEAYYYDEAKTDMDFIFTNPLWIEDNGGGDDESEKIKRNIILGII